MRLLLLLLAVTSLPAAERCPWLNAASAGGALGGPVNTVTVQTTKPEEYDTACSFVRRDGSQVLELRVEVLTLHDPAKEYPAYAARCHDANAPLKAIGNEAVACTTDGGADGSLAEQVIGRVRERAFLIRIRTSDRSTQPSALRESARKIAEQVAGFLF